MLIVRDKSVYDEHLSQPLQTNNKQFKTADTFLVITVFSMLQIQITNYIS